MQELINNLDLIAEELGLIIQENKRLLDRIEARLEARNIKNKAA